MIHSMYVRGPLAVRFWARVEKSDGCWLWKGAHKYGPNSPESYGYFNVGGKEKRKRAAHRLAWELTYGPIPDGLFVLHVCDRQICCNPQHLRLGSQADNLADMVAKGRACRGEQRSVRFTDNHVREIRARYATGGISQAAIAAIYGVSAGHIGSIIRGETWRHLLDSAKS
jgi:hypothetical protein